MTIAATRTLDTEQTEAFNVEYVDATLWQHLYPLYARHLNRPSRFMDVGGGNGKFADRLIQSFPESEGVNLEPAINLIAANNPHPRKMLSPMTLQQLDGDRCGQFDLVCLNWVLHHLVTDRWAASRQCQIDALQKIAAVMAPGASLIVLENVYDGLVIDEGPSKLIHALTASTALQGLVKRAGANTAGVGVCFHSLKGWQDIFTAAGFTIAETRHCYHFGDLSRAKQWALHSRKPRVCLFVLRKHGGNSHA